MSTPVTLKQMEIAREKAARRHRHYENVLVPISMPLSQHYTSYRMRTSNIDFTVDRAGGRQYTSFENSGKRETNRRFPVKTLTPPLTENIPSGIDSDEYKISVAQALCFNGRQHFLSNFYPASLRVEGHEYPSVEHYYQACKLYTLAGANVASEIRNVIDSGQVKIFAKKILRSANISVGKIEEWKRTQGLALLYHALMHKFAQNPDLRSKLLATGDSILAHTYEYDNVYATGCDKNKLMEWCVKNSGTILKVPTRIDTDTLIYIPLVGSGKNVLGFLNMKVRRELRNYGLSKSDHTDPILLTAMKSLHLNEQCNGATCDDEL
uniref:DUF1768 domain-containing protein n=1 Tax=Syphacia muris TaxID=451379 RepID=A0A0N5AMJ3_9BILA